MIKVLVSGACGKMGKEVVNAINEAHDTELVGAVDVINVGEDIGLIALGKANSIKITNDLKDTILNVKPDVVIDFTQPDSAFVNAKTIIEAGARPVIGTTGLKDNEIDELKALAKEKNLSGLIAPNFTTGAVLMMMFAQMAAKYFDNAEIIEYHHNKKKDAPSGTAVKTAQLMSEVKGAIDQFGGKLQGYLGFFDAKVVPPVAFDSSDELLKIKPYGGGGTRFDIIFDYVNQYMIDNLPKCIVILTDGNALFPDVKLTNNIPVLWGIINSDVTPPWGRFVKVDI